MGQVRSPRSVRHGFPVTVQTIRCYGVDTICVSVTAEIRRNIAGMRRSLLPPCFPVMGGQAGEAKNGPEGPS